MKWVGSKRALAPTLCGMAPTHYGRYYEPFMGAAAMYFYTRPSAKSAFLSDTNPHLVNLFLQVQAQPESVHFEMTEHAKQHSKEYYNEIRKTLADSRMDTIGAGLALYLNRACWKGLWRVNRKGGFNTPCTVGSPSFPTVEGLCAVSEALKNVTIECRPAQSTPIERDAFYFLDPPYHTTYTGYHGYGFNEDQQREIFEMCKKIDEAGGRFMLCNSDTQFVRGMYGRFYKTVVNERIGINLRRGGRLLSELVFTNYR